MYATIRHPIYTALVAWASGQALLLRSLWALAVAWALLAPAVAARVREEESLLAQAFGDDYRRYAARTTRFIPHLF